MSRYGYREVFKSLRDNEIDCTYEWSELEPLDWRGMVYAMDDSGDVRGGGLNWFYIAIILPFILV